jgi:hypothetical protein
MAKLPQGTLDLDTAIERLARRKHPDLFVVERGELVEAWRELCQLIVVGKSICPRILNESGDASYEADRAQFVALQERYIFVTRQPLRGFTEKEQRFLEIERPQTSEWCDVHGHIHLRSRVIFLESEVEAILGAGGEAEEAPARELTGGKAGKVPREPSRQRTAVLQAFKTIGLQNLRMMPQKEIVAKIISMVGQANDGLTVSGRLILGIYREHRNT